MDRFEGRGRLEWWANSSTCLGGVEVALTINATGRGWNAHGRLVNDADLDCFELLCELDEVFLLRFEDNSTLVVTVEAAGPHARFTLSEAVDSAGPSTT